MPYKTQASFIEINPEQLSKEQLKLWQQLIKAKTDFGTSLQASAPKGQKVLFSMTYNKLKLALVPDTGNGQMKQLPSLVDFLQARANSGHNA